MVVYPPYPKHRYSCSQVGPKRKASVRRKTYLPDGLCTRRAEHEDDNQFLAEKVMCRNLRTQLRYRLTLRPVPPTALLPLLETRPFKWMISSHHLPDKNQVGDAWKKAPWRMLVRSFFVDLHHELQNGDVLSWQSHQVVRPGTSDMKNSPSSVRAFSGSFSKVWGRRVVFSHQKDGSLAGRWLVVAYIWSYDMDWVRQVDVRTLVSFSSACW
jgi:hypothetical protein